MNQRRLTPLFVTALLMLLAQLGCRIVPTTATVATTVVATATMVAPTMEQQAATAVPQPTAAQATDQPVNEPTATPLPAATPVPTATPAATVEGGAANEDPFAAEAPARDDLRLAVAYQGASPILGTPTAEAPAPQLGDRAEFTIGNVDVNTISTVTAVLQGVGKHAYYWYDEGEGGVVPDTADLTDTIAAFDAIYEKVDDQFGDATPDDDPPVNIVHVSPLALCDVDLTTANQCGLAGYFSGRDELPRSVNKNSNEREMFVMNATQVGGDYYLDVLAHELRHLIEARFDSGEADWAVEGSAMLAAELSGYDDSAQGRGNLFLSDPDLQLNTWSSDFSLPHYGQGYLLSRFLYDQLGPDAYQKLATSPQNGLEAIAALNPDGPDGLTLWNNWLVAMALTTGKANIPAEYRWSGPPLIPVAATSLRTVPTEVETDVSQFAADYYTLPSSGTYTVEFEGDTTTDLLPQDAPSGDSAWYALRSNYANPRLTRTLDLRNVDQATLTYDAYVDIEEGYDFAYVSVSEDAGQTWQPLTADGMQGLEPQDDPSGSALTDRFYTGNRRAWISEEIDLSPYAGKEIELRFEYITDPILTYGGFALDNIRIPEIDFADDAESEQEGWTAEGFVRVPLEVAQSWLLSLITFNDGQVVVQTLTPDADGRLAIPVSAVAGERSPILVVAAHAPQTLEKADYSLTVGN